MFVEQRMYLLRKWSLAMNIVDNRDMCLAKTGNVSTQTLQIEVFIILPLRYL